MTKACDWAACDNAQACMVISTKISCECVEYHEVYDVCESCANIIAIQENDSSCLDCKQIFSHELVRFDLIVE